MVRVEKQTGLGEQRGVEAIEKENGWGIYNIEPRMWAVLSKHNLAAKFPMAH